MARPRVLHDEYFLRAKREGYVARSAYKLLELNERKQLIAPGDRVLDVGCAPGSWLQVAAAIVGQRGSVTGIDLTPVHPALLRELGPRVRTVAADFTTINPSDLLDEAQHPFDAVISDMAPNTTGHGDDFLSARLCHALLDTLEAGLLLRPGGKVTMKILEGEAFTEVMRRTRALFAHAGAFKPRACRDLSRETYIWGHAFRPPRAAHSPASSPAAHRAALRNAPRARATHVGRGAPPPPIDGWDNRPHPNDPPPDLAHPDHAHPDRSEPQR